MKDTEIKKETAGTGSENIDTALEGMPCGCPCGGDSGRRKHRDKNGAEYQDLIRRLNRIEGQVRGVRGMVEDDRYCVDILTQVSAISAALNAFSRELLSNHIKTCVVNDIRNGNDTVVDELCATLQKLMK
jgi:DNA-binding FrmR family transcriptional regulator